MILDPFSPLSTELYSLLSVALVVSAIAVLLAARGEPDPRGYRPIARYLGAIGLITLFVALYAAFGAAGSLTDLVVNHAERKAATPYYFGYTNLDFFGYGMSGAFPIYDFSTNAGNNGNYDHTVASGLVAIITGALFVLTRRWRLRLEAGAPKDAVVVRVGRTYRSGVAAVAGLTLAVSLTTMAYAVFEFFAPNIVTSAAYPDDVIRMEGLAEFLAFGFLAVLSGLIFRRAWRELAPALPALPAHKAPATKRATPAKKRTR
ncbi:MAG: hypothetical protein FJW86_05405 [Actinobacteria bacterium]|nr:hypothetical protein [Actinomycetota bacterium]